MEIVLNNASNFNLMRQLLNDLDYITLSYQYDSSKASDYRGNNTIITGDDASQHYQFELLTNKIQELDEAVLKMGYECWNNIIIDIRTPSKWSEIGGLSNIIGTSPEAIEALKTIRQKYEDKQVIVAIMNSGQLFFDYPMELTELIYQITSDPNSHLLMATGDVSGMDCLTSDVVNCFENRIVFQTENPMFSNMLIGNDEATHLPSPDHYCQYSTKTNQIIIM